jgi:hypothetical protein
MDGVKPDVIVCWPRNCDFPLWRRFIGDNRWRFARVLVVFTQHPGGDLSLFVRGQLDAEFFDSPDSNSGDWRDVAVNHALAYSDAEWVWFTEQDFLIKDPKAFWGSVSAARTQAIGFVEPESLRWHPACLFVRRAAIDQTSRYFGTEPVDHFYRFGRELERITRLHPVQGYEHLQGVSQNHALLDRGETAGLWRMDRFRQYLKDSLAADVPLHPGWAERARQIIEGSAPL